MPTTIRDHIILYSAMNLRLTTDFSKVCSISITIQYYGTSSNIFTFIYLIFIRLGCNLSCMSSFLFSNISVMCIVMIKHHIIWKMLYVQQFNSNQGLLIRNEIKQITETF